MTWYNILVVLVVLVVVEAGPATDSYKDQFCTDPRTMKEHPAYTEWADAYSCTRHRCQPGGRNLAIYTVGCKRVEAPESAIECEEVVEDTNMQFPYCCTRLRCLVVVRGEVWTRVLGQPWETLPAAPWSHMYKMKKPPPGDHTFLPKSPGEGPVYELTSDIENNDKVLRSSKKTPATEAPADCNDVAPRAGSAPDIVIALSTASDVKEQKKKEGKRGRHKRGRKTVPASPYYEEEVPEPLQHNEIEIDKTVTEKEKMVQDATSEEKYFMNSFPVTQKPQKAQPNQQMVWTENTETPPTQWNGEHDSPMMDPDVTARDGNSHIPDVPSLEEKNDEKPNNLQALVDAIGSRMRDIENVVQRMSEKVQHAKPQTSPDSLSAEKRPEAGVQPPRKHRKLDSKELKAKQPAADGEHYKRGSKYLHAAGAGTEQPLFVEDTNMNGYFSDGNNNLLRRSSPPKEPAPTYMAPVENRRKGTTHIGVSEASEENEKKRKKHTHKKKKGKGKGKKKHRKDEKKRRVKVSSVELDRNVVSLEDSSAVTNT